MSRTRLLPLLSLFGLLVAAAPSASAQSSAELRRRAETAYLEMEFDAAIEQLDQAIEACASTCADDERAALHLFRGTVVLDARRDEDGARREYRRALALDADAALDLRFASPKAEEVFAEARAAHALEASAPEASEAPAREEAARTSYGPRKVKWNRGFFELGYSLTMATAHDDMRAGSQPTLANPGDDPQLDAIPENDSYVLSGTGGCGAPEGEYCVRVTDGLMAFAHGIHLSAGFFLTERFAIAGRVRLNPQAGSGTLSHALLGLRAHVSLTEPKLEGFHASVYGGFVVGQIQTRPRQEPTPPATEVERPWVRTGLGGLELGAKLGYRFKPNVGLFAAPELVSLFPRYSLVLQATVGLDFSFGEAEAIVYGPVEEAAARVADEDEDGVPDERDQCPSEAEDRDGFEDDDGCPDEDDDADGVPDERDQCPRDPEDRDGFQDDDGCPDKDDDGDGVFDAEDDCPREPGPALNQGCPIPDRDGDAIADRFDNCPDEPGSPENMGCPIPQLVQIEEKQIKILDAIHFKRNGHVIDKRSYPLLDQLASVIREHPEIAHVRIEGHTDSTGRAEYNRALSRRRAESVLDYLVKKGRVEEHRLSAHGFGPDRPIHPDAQTEEEHAANRRVEFVTLTE